MNDGCRGDLSDEAYVTRGWSVIELAKSEAVTQESLGRSPISANLFVAIMAEVYLVVMRAIVLGIADVLASRPNGRRSDSNEQCSAEG